MQFFVFIIAHLRMDLLLLLKVETSGYHCIQIFVVHFNYELLLNCKSFDQKCGAWRP